MRANHHVAKSIAECGRPFTNGKFVKKCMVQVLEEMCPAKIFCVSCVSLSVSTITRHVNELGVELHMSLMVKAIPPPLEI